MSEDIYDPRTESQEGQCDLSKGFTPVTRNITDAKFLALESAIRHQPLGYISVPIANRPMTLVVKGEPHTYEAKKSISPWTDIDPSEAATRKRFIDQLQRVMRSDYSADDIGIGILTAESVVAVIDLDTKHLVAQDPRTDVEDETKHQDAARELLTDLLKKAGIADAKKRKAWIDRFIKMPHVRTPSGGFHWYFRRPKGAKPRSGNSHIIKNIDVKAGYFDNSGKRHSGGLAYGPGTVTDFGAYRSIRYKDGMPVEHDGLPPVADLEELPIFLISLFEKQPKPTGKDKQRKLTTTFAPQPTAPNEDYGGKVVRFIPGRKVPAHIAARQRQSKVNYSGIVGSDSKWGPIAARIVTATDPKVRKYVERAVAEELRVAAESEEGERNSQLNASAFAIGTLVGAGVVDEELARNALEQVATECGLDASEIDTTIKSGLGGGMAEPRELSKLTNDATRRLETEQTDDALVNDLSPGFVRVGRDIFYRLEATADPEGNEDDEEKEEVQLIHVVSDLRFCAAAHEEGGGGHRLIVQVWSNTTNRYTDWIMERASLKGDGAEARGEILSRGGTPPTTRRKRELLNRLLAEARPPKVMLSAGQTGWVGLNGDNPRFVLPDGVYGVNGTGEGIVFTGRPDKSLRAKGARSEWTKNVSEPMQGNSRLVFATSLSFGASVMGPCQFDPFIAHFPGDSSIGKTTSLYAVGSVWGGGPNDYKGSWSATANGFEARAAARDGMALTLDDIAKADPGQIGTVAYRYSDAKGKARMTKGLALQDSKTWSNLGISNGEHTLEQYLNTGKLGGTKTKAKAGQEVRLLNIPADAGKGFGIFDCVPSGLTAEQFAIEIKANTGKFYGTAGREFVGRFAEEYNNSVERVHQYIDEFVKGRKAAIQKYLVAKPDTQVTRALRQFGIAAAAGRLATEWGLTGWPHNHAFWAASTCFAAWLGARKTLGNHEGRSAAESLREFVATQGGRFQDRQAHSAIPRDRVGFRETYLISAKVVTPQVTGVRYLIFDHTLSEVCGGIAEQPAAQALKSAGLLTLPTTKGLKHYPSIAGTRYGMYHIEGDRL